VQRRAQISIRRLRRGGALLHLLFPQVARAHYSRGGSPPSPIFLSLSLSPFLVFYFRLDVSAGAKAPGCVATNDEGFIGENGEDGRGPRARGGLEVGLGCCRYRNRIS